MSEWKTVKLGDLVTFQRGHDLTRNQMQEGDYPVAGSNGVIGFHNEYTTKAPSITIGRSGNIGNAYYFNTDFWAHNTTLYIKEFKNCDPKFIYYLLLTMNFGGHNSGSAVPSLNRNYIHPIEVKAPDLPTQTQIAQILTSLDDKIELNLQMNQTLEAMAQAIFKEWCTTENDEIPEGWNIKELAELADVSSSKRIFREEYTLSGVPFYRGKEVTQLSNGESISTELFISNERYEEIKEKFGVPQVGEILITSVGTIGSIWLVDNDSPFYFKDGNYPS
jgi:type I restriction enzyme, S subunit